MNAVKTLGYILAVIGTALAGITLHVGASVLALLLYGGLAIIGLLMINKGLKTEARVRA